MAVSQSALSRHWGISRNAVQKRIKAGCPVNSIRAAELWWEKRPQQRAPTSGPNVGKFAVEHPEGLAPIGGLKEKRPRGRPITPKQPARTGDTLKDALQNAITIQERAFERVERGLINDHTNVSALLHVHTKALEARFEAEKRYREEMERRGVLIEKTIAADIVRRAIEPVLRRLRKLPPERGPECNDAPDAIASVKILQKEVDKIIEVGRNSLTLFGKDGTG